MTFLGTLDLILMLTQGLVSVATKNEIDDAIVAALRRGLAELNTVRDSQVTKAQVESLRVEPKW